MRAYANSADTLLRVCEQRLRPLVPVLEGHGRAELLRAIAELHQLEAQQRRGLRTAVYIFAQSAKVDEWYVGHPDRVHRVNWCSLGLPAALQAFQGYTPVCADFSKPGAKNADDVVRKAVRVTIPAWLEEIGCHEIANEFRRMRVEGGRLYYRRAADSPQIRTTYVFPMSAELPAG